MNMNKPSDETLKQGRNRSWLLVKFAENMIPWIREVSRISAVDEYGTSLIWKSISKSIEYRFQRFVGLHFGTQNILNKTKKTYFGIRF